MRGRRRWGVVAMLLTAVVGAAALAAGIGGSATAATRGPIVIGWAFDAKGQMAPFDGPALATAKIRVREINAQGGVNGRKLRLDTCDTQDNNPARAKSCAR
jgi:branched-chain amino acid transport system substrate-binding protein